jgi:hypothetical protein
VKKLFRNGRYANVTATLALFIALGGTSYAVTSLPRNSVSTKQIKAHAVTLSKISEGAKNALKGQTGARGPTGPTGPAGPAGAGPGSTLWAAVNYQGHLSRNSHAVDAVLVQTTTSTYRVTFDRDVSGCVYTATVGGEAGGGGEQTVTGDVSVAPRSGFPNTIVVNTYNGSGTADQARPFYVAIHC